MGVVKKNLYTASYANLNTYSIAATSIKNAVTLLNAAHEEEPQSIKLVAEAVIVEGDSSDQCTVTAICEPALSGANVYPSNVTAELGDSIYFTAVVPDGYEVDHWIVDGEEIASTNVVLKVSVNSEHKTRIDVICVLAKTQTLPAPLTELTCDAKSTTCVISWAAYTEEFESIYVAVQDKLTLETVFAQFVNSDPVNVTGLTASTAYVVSTKVLGTNGLYSELVTQEFTTSAALTVHPALASIEYAADTHILTFVTPTDEVFASNATGIALVLEDASGETVHSETLAPDVDSYDITEYATATVAKARVNYDDLVQSDAVQVNLE